jgi:hypothetical protein
MQARKLKKMKECVITRLLVLSFNRYQHPIFINSHLMQANDENRASRLFSYSDHHHLSCVSFFERETAKLYNNFGSKKRVQVRGRDGEHVLYFKLLSMTPRNLTPKAIPFFFSSKQIWNVGVLAKKKIWLKTGRKIAHNQSSPGERRHSFSWVCGGKERKTFKSHKRRILFRILT